VILFGGITCGVIRDVLDVELQDENGHRFNVSVRGAKY
jgi:hypothetical protein